MIENKAIYKWGQFRGVYFPFEVYVVTTVEGNGDGETTLMIQI